MAGNHGPEYSGFGPEQGGLVDFAGSHFGTSAVSVSSQPLREGQKLPLESEHLPVRMVAGMGLDFSGSEQTLPTTWQQESEPATGILVEVA